MTYDKYDASKLVELAQELERQKESKRDYVVDTRTLTAEEANGKLVIRCQSLGEPLADFVYPLTSHAHNQLAEKCGIPQKYYDKMLSAKLPELVARNVNAWLPQKERRLIRTLDGNIRAILSDKYKTMDNYDVLFLALEKLKEHGAVVQRADLSDTNFFLKAIIPSRTEYVSPDDPLQRGIVIKNSEVGAGAFSVEPFLYRLVCQNGMIGEDTIKRVHLGRRHDVGEIFSDMTRSLEDQALWSGVKDVIDATFDNDYFTKWVAELKNAASQNVAKPVEAIDYVVREYKLPEDAKRSLLDYFMLDGVAGVTVYGVANSITRYAQDMSDYGRQVELEAVGARVIKDSGLLKVAGVV